MNAVQSTQSARSKFTDDFEILNTDIYMSQDLTKGTFWQYKSKVRYLQRKKDLAVVNSYRKFEEIIFTNNKDMSV